MSDEIAVGDVVRLKSGSPNMVVVAIDRQQFDDALSVWCEWFDEKHKPQKGTFHLVAVVKADVSTPPAPAPAPAPAPKRRIARVVRH